MGNLFSKIWWRNSKKCQSLDSINSQSQLSKSKRTVESTAFPIWNQSSKTINDLIDLFQSEASSQQNHQTGLAYISMINNRNKLEEYLWGLQKYLLQLSGEILNDEEGQSAQQKYHNKYPCKLSAGERSYIFKEIHIKYANLWFISQKGNKNSTPWIHQKQLQQLWLNRNFGEKLCYLYLNSISMDSNKPKLFQKWITSALLSNHPLLLTAQTLHIFIQTIIDQEIYIVEDEAHFTRFITTLMKFGIYSKIQSHNQQSAEPSKFLYEYTEKVLAQLNVEDQQFHDEMKNEIRIMSEFQQKYSNNKGCQNWVIHSLINEGKQFLKVGNPYSMSIIFKCAINLNYQNFTSEEIDLYFYTKIFETFLYSPNSFVDLNFFDGLYKMEIRDIIHMLLTDNQLANLQILQVIYTEVKLMIVKSDVPNRKDLSQELQDYIFSKYCTLKLCIEILNNPAYINFKKNEYNCHEKIRNKIKDCKFEVLLENQKVVQKLIKNAVNQDSKLDATNPIISLSSFEILISAINLLYTFGVNERVSDIWLFFQDFESQPSFSAINLHKNYLQLRALFILKSLVSKYFTTPNKLKTITIGHSNPLVYQMSSPDLLFHIGHYLYSKVFGNVILKVSDIHQIIFQHMLYFYKYEQLKQLLSSQDFLKKFGVQYEMVELLIIQNINQSLIQNSQLKKISKDISIQLKLLKTDSVENQAMRSTYTLLKYLSEQHSIQLQSHQKQKINISLLYNLIKKYPEKIDMINFDQLYEDIKTINSNQIKEQYYPTDIKNEEYLMTNELLQFKSVLAFQAFKLNKKKFGNQLIDEIGRFKPPWITTKLIQIFKTSQNMKIDDKLFGIAIKSCVKGKDMEYLLKGWSKNNKNQYGQKKFNVGQYFETGRQYLILDETIVINDYQYRNFIAQTKFSDQTLAHKHFELFYILLGTQPERAFHHAFKTNLDLLKLELFLKEGMKLSIFNPYNTTRQLLKLSYYIYSNEIPTFTRYKQKKFVLQDLFTLNQQFLNKSKLKNSSELSSMQQEVYKRSLKASIFSILLSQSFINKYVLDSPNTNLNPQNNIKYTLLYNEASCKNTMMGLMEEPMGRTDISQYYNICTQGLKINNIIELCVFKLSNRVNVSEQDLSQEAQNILQKLLVLIENHNEAHKILKKFIDRVFSMRMFVKILHYLKDNYNQYFSNIITSKHIQILQALASVEESQEFAGIVPEHYFTEEFSEYYSLQIQPNEEKNKNVPKLTNLSEKHRLIINNCQKKTNIFILSKVLYFFYGMNSKIERQIIQGFMNSSQVDPEVEVIWENIKLSELNET